MSLSYPTFLDQSDSPFLKIDCFEWKIRNKKEKNARLTKSIIETIFLPTPSNGLTESIINNWDVTDNITKDSVSDFGKSFVAQKLAGISENLTKFISYNTGQILNDFSSLTFSGNNFREFNLNYEMFATSSDEAEQIKNIVKTFKRNSLPEYEGFKISYPRFWTIELHIPNGESPIVFKNCVLVDCVSDYFKDENIAPYKDGNLPVSVSLNFRELVRLSRKDIE